MLGFVAEDLIAELAEDDRLRRVAEGIVVDLRDDLGGDEDHDGSFEATGVAKEAEDGVSPGAADARNSGEVHRAAEVAAVTLFLGDEAAQGVEVLVIAADARITPATAEEFAAIAAFAELKLLDGFCDGDAFGIGEDDAAFPGDGQKMAGVVAKVFAPR